MSNYENLTGRGHACFAALRDGRIASSLERRNVGDFGVNRVNKNGKMGSRFSDYDGRNRWSKEEAEKVVARLESLNPGRKYLVVEL